MKERGHHLEEIGFQRIAPSLALQPYVHWFWAMQANKTVLQKHYEFMHSSGSLSLLFNWGDELETNTRRYSQSAVLEEVNLHSRQIVLTGNIHMFGVLFRPGGAFRFFGMPMKEVMSDDSLYSFNLHQLHDELSAFSALQSKVERMESWLINLLASDYRPSRFIPKFLKCIDNNSGSRSIQEIADSFYVSERQLERLFKKEVGLSPKQYANLVRVHRARVSLKQANTATLADVACRFGFYDQAHFNREFKRIIGIIPGSYVSRQEERQADQSGVSLQRQN